MLYRYLSSKKGFTMMEILIVVAVLGVLVSVAVPVFDTSLKVQRRNDCRNQRLVIETAVKQAMYGMIDNGKRQEKITFPQGCSTYVGDGVPNSADDDFVEDPCYVLTYPAKGEGETVQMKPYIAGVTPFTFAALRGGYRPNSNDDDPVNGLDYDEGCEKGYYLKKKKYQDDATAFYRFLDNQEIPVCPFANYDDADDTNDYYYYIFEDGKVVCSCSECNVVD